MAMLEINAWRILDVLRFVVGFWGSSRLLAKEMHAIEMRSNQEDG